LFFSSYVLPPPTTSPLPLHDAFPMCNYPLNSLGDFFFSYATAVTYFHEHEFRLVSQPTIHAITELPVTGSGNRCLCPVQLSNGRSEEHTSELQSLTNLVCPLLLAKKNILVPQMSVQRVEARGGKLQAHREHQGWLTGERAKRYAARGSLVGAASTEAQYGQ